MKCVYFLLFHRFLKGLVEKDPEPTPDKDPMKDEVILKLMHQKSDEEKTSADEPTTPVSTKPDEVEEPENPTVSFPNLSHRRGINSNSGSTCTLWPYYKITDPNSDLRKIYAF